MTERQVVEAAIGLKIFELSILSAVTACGKIFSFQRTPSGRIRKGSIRRDPREEEIASLYLKEVQSQQFVMFGPEAN